MTHSNIHILSCTSQYIKSKKRFYKILLNVWDTFQHFFFSPLNNDCNLFSSHHYPQFEKDRYKTSDFLLKPRFWSKFSGAQTCYPILHMKNWVLRGYMTSPMWVQCAPAPSSCACTCAHLRPPHPPTTGRFHPPCSSSVLRFHPSQ